MPGKGDKAPGFSLDGTDGTEAGRRTYSLEEFRGDPVVLVFYPADNSPVCTVQLRSYTEDISSFADVGAHVLAISPQSVEDAKKVLRVVEMIEDNDDVQDVFANFDIPDDVMDKVMETA